MKLDNLWAMSACNDKDNVIHCAQGVVVLNAQ